MAAKEERDSSTEGPESKGKIKDTTEKTDRTPEIAEEVTELPEVNEDSTTKDLDQSLSDVKDEINEFLEKEENRINEVNQNEEEYLEKLKKMAEPESITEFLKDSTELEKLPPKMNIIIENEEKDSQEITTIPTTASTTTASTTTTSTTTTSTTTTKAEFTCSNLNLGEFLANGKPQRIVMTGFPKSGAMWFKSVIDNILPYYFWLEEIVSYFKERISYFLKIVYNSVRGWGKCNIKSNVSFEIFFCSRRRIALLRRKTKMTIRHLKYKCQVKTVK